jgi:hypothetical protein
VLQQRDPGAELTERQRLVGGQRPGGEHPDAPVADLPAVAVRAVQHVDAPPVGQAGNVGQLVACPGGEQHAAGRGGPGADLDAEQVAVSFEGVGAAAGDLPAVGPHFGAPRGIEVPG